MQKSKRRFVKERAKSKMNQQSFQIRCYPAFEPKYYKLPGVKECLYHPQLPTFRRMDIDTAAHKLPDAHCRTTTPCSARDFRRGAATLNIKSANSNSSKANSQVDRYWRYRHLYSYTNSSSKEQEDENGESTHDQTDESAVDPTTQSRPCQKPWRFVLRQEPYIDHIGQRPIPATIYSRYRSLTSSYGGQVSTNNWRP